MRSSTSRNPARMALRRVLRRWVVGELEVRWSDGAEEIFVGEAVGDRARVEIHDERTLAAALINDGSVGLGGAYIAEAWDAPDLAAFLELASANVDHALASGVGGSGSSLLRRWWDARPDFARSHQIGVIGDHYDLGNDFYRQWLDPTMTYSSAIYDGDETLEAAQYRKYERLCALLDLRPGDRVLEIGCGWGGFAEYAATNHDVSVTGLTLSTEMATFARKRLADAGLSDRTDIKIQDFRDEHAMYDKVVSIEMIESVDETAWAPLFHAISRAIPPGGRAVMQAITIDERYFANLLRRDDFIKRYIFPGGALPTVELLEQLSSDAGMEWIESEAHGLDYASTLEQWLERFDDAWPAIVRKDQTFDEPFRRMWRYYLAYCEAGFRTGRLDGIQFGMQRPV